MVTVLYSNFLEDKEQYDASERFWATLFASVAAEFGNGADWVPWRPRAYANGLPFERDGNPIFDARQPHASKAVQVIQWPPQSNELEISAWISELPLVAEDEPAILHELTINCSLSIESARVAKELLRHWVDKAVSVSEMDRLITRLTMSDGQ